jgi:hypothetical protein
MELLDALVEVVGSLKGIKTRENDIARLVHSAFDENSDNAYLSELELEELVPLLEEWCKQRRIEMGTVQ